METLKDLSAALGFAEENKNKELEGKLHNKLGIHYWSIGKYDRAMDHLKVYLTIAKETGDKKGEGIAYGNLGTCYRSLGEYDKAIKCLGMHLTLAVEIGDKEGKGKACGNLGTCYISLGQYDKAIKYLKMHLTLAVEIGDRQGEGVAWGNLGTCYNCLGQYHKAIRYLEMRLTIATKIGDKKSEGKAYSNLGSCYRSLSQYDKAIKYEDMCLAIATETGDKEGEGTAYGNLGACYSSFGQYNKAIKYNEMHLTIATEIGDKQGKGTAYGNLGCCYHSLGQYDKAIKYHEMCLTIATKIGNKGGEGTAYGNLGNCYHSLGQYDKAIKYHDMCLTIATEIGDKQGEGTAYGNLGTCYIDLGQYDKAINYLEMCLTIARGIGHKKGEGAAYGNLGSCHGCLGQYKQAIKYHEMLLNIVTKIGDKEGEEAAYGNLGTCFSNLGQYNNALQYYEMCLIIAREIGDKEREGSVYGNIGTCYRSLGQYEKAESNLRKCVECCEELFENVPKRDEDKVSVIDTFVCCYEELVYILLTQEKRADALVISERGRSRALADLMLTTNRGGYSEGKVSNLHKIRKVVKALGSTVLFFTRSGSCICSWVIQPNGDILFQQHRIDVPQQSRSNDMGEAMSPSELLKSLVNKVVDSMKPRAVKCEDRSLSFLYQEEFSKSTKEKPEIVEACAAMPVDLTFPQPVVSQPRVLPPSPVEEQETARSTAPVRQDKTEVTTSHEKSNESMLHNCLLKDLYQILLEPVRQYVVGSQVIVVPEGQLALTPFAAFVDENGHYVAESLRVSFVPSLATAKMIRERPHEPAGQERLIMGDPDVGIVLKGGKLIPVPRLPCAKKEVEVVGQFLKVEPLVGEKATKKTFLRKVESATLIHVAAHGDAERGEILLAPRLGSSGKNRKDYMLLISDLERKRLKAKLVVLSCCHSGRGDVRGEGVVGIARAFLGAGARAVLVTLWAVDDGATLWFMAHFYKHLVDGESASEAIKAAMKAVRELEGFHHPRYWAPFVLLGEDVTPFGRP